MNKQSGWLGHHFTKARNFFNSFGKNSKQMPLWKKEGGCLLAWEPAVQCNRGRRVFACSDDSQCACKVGCSGIGLTQSTMIWRPVCYRISGGINQCICGLVHSTLKKEACTWPGRYEQPGDLKDTRYYSGDGTGGYQSFQSRATVDTMAYPAAPAAPAA